MAGPADPPHGEVHMGRTLRAMALACGLAIAGSAWAEVTFYEHDDFRGRSFTVMDSVDNFARFGFNDRASSAVVRRGSYEVCEHAGYHGRCVTLAPVIDGVEGTYTKSEAAGANCIPLLSTPMIVPACAARVTCETCASIVFVRS